MPQWFALTVLGLVLVVAMPWSASAGPVIRVGNGTAASCTETALRNALTVAEAQGGGIVYFRCGSAPVAISVLETLILPDDTTINGGGLVTVRAAVIDNFTRLDRLIWVDRDASVVLSNLVVAGAFISITNHGSLTLNNTTVTSGINNNIVNSGNLTVLNSVIRFELQDIAGGGISNSGYLFVHDTLFLDNFGSGIANSGEAVVNDSTFFSNQYEHGHGGAIINWESSSFATAP
jgi:hypothetical protein